MVRHTSRQQKHSQERRNLYLCVAHCLCRLADLRVVGLYIAQCAVADLVDHAANLHTDDHTFAWLDLEMGYKAGLCRQENHDDMVLPPRLSGGIARACRDFVSLGPLLGGRCVQFKR